MCGWNLRSQAMSDSFKLTVICPSGPHDDDTDLCPQLNGWLKYVRLIDATSHGLSRPTTLSMPIANLFCRYIISVYIPHSFSALLVQIWAASGRVFPGALFVTQIAKAG